MSTRKLYYEDCYLASFRAMVLSCKETERGYEVLLDRTAFYPEGGGQAADTGFLGAARVLDTREQGNLVIHITDAPLEVGTEVDGAVDWLSRFDRMQQHTGEHIVSGILNRRFGMQNVGFHMGQELVTIDFDGVVSEEELEEVEREANEIIWKNLEVKCWYPSPEELPGVAYRSKRALPWPVRIVEIPGVDCCACCGVHVQRTGEAGPIKLLSCVKFRQGVRIEMACGNRALRYLSAVLEQNRRVSRLLSAKPLETAASVEQLKEQLAAEKFKIVGLQRTVFDGIAKSYVNYVNVVHFEDGISGDGLRELADKIANVCTGFAAVFSGEDGEYRFCLMGQSDLKALCREMSTALNARGGGKPNCQQGTVRATKAQIEDFFANR